MDANDLRRGQRVIVTYDSEHRDDKEAIVRRVPPWTETVVGNEVEHTDEVDVQYPNTSIDGGDFFADISEAVPVENVRPK